MLDQRQCAECGAELPPQIHDGLCSRCLLKVGMVQSAEHDPLHIRCPHCRNPIQLIDDSPIHDITCPSCDSKFSLVGEDSTTATHDKSARIGQFELIHQIGVGGFGAVWKARDTELDRIVAVKVPTAKPDFTERCRSIHTRGSSCGTAQASKYRQRV